VSLLSWSSVKKGIELAEVCTTAFEIIRDLVKNRPGKPEDLLAQIGAIVTHVQEAWAGNITPAEAREALAKLKADIAQNNADVDAAADEKFGKH
jgi:hypothetical protein